MDRTNMEYFAVLGNNPALSVAEIASVLPKIKIVLHSPEVLVFSESGVLDLVRVQEQLGGSIKLGKIVARVASSGEWGGGLIETIGSRITAPDKGRVNFGISLYRGLDKKTFFEIKGGLQRLGLTVKKELKARDISARFVTSKMSHALSSVIVAKNSLLESDGYEFVVIPGDGGLLLGQTHTVQDFSRYSFFDYERPARDVRAGMLPPKVAQMMLNLAGANPDRSVVLDPFCGSGTIVTQAVMLGYKHVIGNDISDKAVRDTEKNLYWLKEHAPGAKDIDIISGKASPKHEGVSLCLSDVRHLSKILPAASIDAIVTEPHMGPPLRGRETREDVLANVRTLERLYADAFIEFAKILKPGGRVVFICPVFSLGTTPLQPSDNFFGQSRLKKLDLSVGGIDLSHLTYERAEQRVKRTILVFGK